MSRRRGGLYIGPWTLRIIVGAITVGVVGMFIYQLPDLRRYIKFESM